jgi:hypothetical protein
MVGIILQADFALEACFMFGDIGSARMVRSKSLVRRYYFTLQTRFACKSLTAKSLREVITCRTASCKR